MGVLYFVATILGEMDLRNWIGPFWYIGIASSLAGPISVWINRIENEK